MIKIVLVVDEIESIEVELPTVPRIGETVELKEEHYRLMHKRAKEQYPEDKREFGSCWYVQDVVYDLNEGNILVELSNSLYCNEETRKECELEE